MDKHRLRRAILSAVKDLEPALATIDDLAEYPLLKRGAVPREGVSAECRALSGHGYLCDRRPGREPLYSLTAPGRDQINQETDLDEFVWGEMASKFAGGC